MFFWSIDYYCYCSRSILLMIPMKAHKRERGIKIFNSPLEAEAYTHSTHVHCKQINKLRSFVVVWHCWTNTQFSHHSIDNCWFSSCLHFFLSTYSRVWLKWLFLCIAYFSLLFVYNRKIHFCMCRYKLVCVTIVMITYIYFVLFSHTTNITNMHEFELPCLWNNKKPENCRKLWTNTKSVFSNELKSNWNVLPFFCRAFFSIGLSISPYSTNTIET